MVRVPVYEGGVSTRPVNQQGVEGRAIEGAFGGGQGLQALGAGLGRLGAALSQARDLEDMTRAKDAENEFALFMQNHMYGEGGYMLSEGKGAFDGRAGFMEEAEKKRREIAGRLKGGAQRSFNEASTARMLNVNQQALIHAGNQQKQWVKETSAARANLFAQDALNSVGNREQINRHIAAGILEMRAQAELEGMPAEALSVKEKAYVSGVQAGVVLQLANADPLAAESYMKEVGNQLEPQTRFELEKKLKEPLLQARAVRAMQLGKLKQVGEFNFSPQVENAIVSAAAKYGVPQEALAVIAMIESGGNPSAKNHNSSAGGLFQQIDSNARQYGVKNRYDAGQSADGAAAFMRDNQEHLRRVLGRAPTVGELYLAHQQGAAGAAKLLSNPNARAIDVVDVDAVRLNKGKNDDMDMTAREFANLWIRKAERVGGGGEAMEEYIASIEDPELRAATQSLFEKQVAADRKSKTEAKAAAIDWVDSQMETYPQMDLNSLPIEMQAQIGAKAMQSLRETQKKMLKRDDVVSDDNTYLELSRLYADDKAAFGEVNLLEYRDKLSDSDWKQVAGWWRQAREDVLKGGSDRLGISQAMSQASIQLAAVGISEKDDAKKVAQFKRTLDAELKDFFKQNKRAANDGEMEEIINRLLLPIVISEPGWLWGTNNKDGYLFEARTRTDNATAQPKVEYNSIPFEERRMIAIDLQAELGRLPSEEETYLRWFEWKTGIEQEKTGGGDGIPAWRFMVPFPAPLPRPSGKK